MYTYHLMWTISTGRTTNVGVNVPNRSFDCRGFNQTGTGPQNSSEGDEMLWVTNERKKRNITIGK